MVNIKEYEKYFNMYQEKMCKLLLERGVKLPDDTRHNIVALRFYMEREGMLVFYPVLERVLNVVNDCSASTEVKLSAMQKNISEAFNQVKIFKEEDTIMEYVKTYEKKMVEILKNEKKIDADFMLFPELYKIFEDTGLIDKYPNLITVKQLLANETVSDKGKEIILKTLYAEVMTPNQ